MALSARERAVLDFEGSWWLAEGSKAAAIAERLGLSASRYYEVLAGLVDSPDAGAYAPLVVRRLRRTRDRRRTASERRREGRTAGGPPSP